MPHTAILSIIPVAYITPILFNTDVYSSRLRSRNLCLAVTIVVATAICVEIDIDAAGAGEIPSRGAAPKC
jgi:hypothetical protein